jgi:predicted nucleic acid-binding protein
VRTFLDTNVLVYAYDHSEPVKRNLADQVLSTIDPDDLVLSAQVLSEFYLATTRQGRQLLTPEHAARVVRWFANTRVEPVDADLIGRAVLIQERHQVSYWDALIVAAAVRRDCARMLTEDLSHGTVIEGVEIVDPFR